MNSAPPDDRPSAQPFARASLNARGHPSSVSTPPADEAAARALQARIAEALARAGGWLPFDRFMAMALVEPGLGYYARGAPTFGLAPSDGSDFATAPEMSPLFGRALARQVAQALDAGAPALITEFGGGSGALAETLLDALDALPPRNPGQAQGGAGVAYRIVEVSAALRERQRERLARFGERVQWLDALPERLDGVVLGNEVIDALPVQLLHWDGRQWWERGVVLSADAGAASPSAQADSALTSDFAFAFADRPTALRPPVDGPFAPGTTVELHAQGEAFAATVAERLHQGLALFIDYGFPQAEYYHPQRTGGTLMCHRLHRSDPDPLGDVGLKDITAHVDFTGIALAAQAAGCEVLGYTSQARFLMNLGLVQDMAEADVRSRIAAHRLLAEHEMGELFKVIAFGRGLSWPSAGPAGFAVGDRCHRL